MIIINGKPQVNRTVAFAYVSTPAATECATPGTWYRLAGTFTNETMIGYAIVGDFLTYQGASQTCIKVQVCASFSTNTNNAEVSVGLYKNGGLEVNSVMTGEIDATTDVMPLSLVDVLTLDYGDTIEIRITTDKTANITAEAVTTSATEC